MDEKYLKILHEFRRLGKSFAAAGTIDRENRAKYKKLKPLHDLAAILEKIEEEIDGLRELAGDRAMRALYDEELIKLREKYEETKRRLDAELSKSPFEGRPVIVEIRAGTGGKEAGLFAADIFKMYQKLIEVQGLKIKIFSVHPVEMGGIREVIFEVSGEKAYYFFRFEAGIHRVQRVPVTESSGRIHTSAASVAVYPEPEDVEVNINPADLRIDTYRSSGKGGQHVNKTDSAVRITHIPTGAVASCQEERSQLQNKRRAMTMLKARIYDMEKRAAQENIAGIVRAQVASGDRSEKIRTYNFPQNRVTDHRIKFSIHNLDVFMEGRIAQMTGKLWEGLAADAGAAVVQE